MLLWQLFCCRIGRHFSISSLHKSHRTVSHDAMSSATVVCSARAWYEISSARVMLCTSMNRYDRKQFHGHITPAAAWLLLSGVPWSLVRLFMYMTTVLLLLDDAGPAGFVGITLTVGLYAISRKKLFDQVAAWCSASILVSINVVALHWA